MSQQQPPQPRRIRRSRAKGWKLPENAVIVDRSSRWGNPFIVGKHGTTARCLELYRALLSGYLCVTTDNVQEQEQARAALMQEKRDGWPTLRGKDLACWCRLDKPCHADVLLEIANEPS